MASPIGHGLLGLAVARLAPVGELRSRVRWYAFAVLLANLPDLDFLPGLVIGDAGSFHRGPSHSLLAVVVAGAVAASLARGSRAGPWRVGLASAALYASHLLLDFLAEDPASPVGQPLLWPLRSDPVISAWAPFLGVVHGGRGLSDFVGSVLTAANCLVIAREVAVLGPILVLVWLAGRRRERET